MRATDAVRLHSCRKLVVRRVCDVLLAFAALLSRDQYCLNLATLSTYLPSTPRPVIIYIAANGSFVRGVVVALECQQDWQGIIQSAAHMSKAPSGWFIPLSDIVCDS